MDEIIFYLNSAVYLGMMYYGFSCMFKPAIKKKWLALIYIASWVIASQAFLHFESGWINLSVNIVYFLSLTFLFAGKLSARFVFALLLYVLSIVADAISFASLSYIYYQQLGTEMSMEFILTVARTVSNIVFLPLLLISTIAFRKFLKRNAHNRSFKTPASYTIFVFLLLLGIIVINLFLIVAEIYYVQTTLLRIIVSQFIVLVIIFFVVWLYNALLDHLDAQEKSRQKDLLLERWEMQYQTVASAQKVMAELQHNLRYHFVTLLEYAKNGAVKEIEAHITNEIGAFDHIINTGNLSFDAILNYYSQRIKETLDISLEASLWIPPNMKLDAAFIVMALGNALENAMEACLHVAPHERYVRLEAKASPTEDLLLIIIENPYGIEPVIDESSRLVTTKSEKRNHGFGLSSIQEHFPQKAGHMDVEYGNGVFRFKLLFYHVLGQKHTEHYI